MDMRVDRRGFLAAGAAVAGTAMCAGTLRAAGMAWDGKVAAGSFVHAFCTGSDAWSDLSPAAIFRALQDDTVFSVGGAAPGRVQPRLTEPESQREGRFAQSGAVAPARAKRKLVLRLRLERRQPWIVASAGLVLLV